LKLSAPDEELAPENPGLIKSLASLGASLLGLVKTRAELIVTEFEEEKERRKEMAILALIMSVFFCIGLQLLAIFIIVCFWDSYRILAAAGVTLVYLGIGLVALLTLKSKIHNRPRAFAGTLEEFENDAQGLHAFMDDLLHRRHKSSHPKTTEGE
jgi:uncharacterized membrane protein YqjE